MADATRLTYGEMRSNAEKIADANLKAAVLAGMAVLQERYPDTWQDRIDVDALLLESPDQCVLAQTYDPTLLTDGEVDRVKAAASKTSYGSAAPRYWAHLWALNGDVEVSPEEFGFNEPDDVEGEPLYSYRDLTAAWTLVLTGEEQ